MTRKITRIVIHCTDTKPEWMQNHSAQAKVKEIDRWHRNRGFTRGFGYHWLIDRPGVLAPGRPEETTGAHVLGHNSDTIGVALVGGYGCKRTDQFYQHFTTRQRVRLMELLRDLKKRYPDAEIVGHNDLDNRECPGFSAREFVRDNLNVPAAPPPTGIFAAIAAAIAAIFGGIR